MYRRLSLTDLDAVPVDRPDSDASVLPVGYELRPERMRPNVWRLPAGEAVPYHRQREQEELYLVLDGRFEVRISVADQGDGDRPDVEGDDGGDGHETGGDDAEERFELSVHDVLVVDPADARQLTAIEDGLLFVVGAPNVADDGVVLDDSGTPEGDATDSRE